MNRPKCAAVAVSWILLGVLCGLAMAATPVAPIGLLPQPQAAEWGSGEFALKPDTTILVDRDSAEAQDLAGQLARRLQGGTGMDLKVLPADNAGNAAGPQPKRATARSRIIAELQQER